MSPSQPDPVAAWAPSPSEPPVRRRRWPWLIAVAAVAALVVVAWIVGEQVARGIVDKVIRDRIRAELSLPADHPIDVEIPGALLPQLIGGSIADLSIASDAVPLDAVDGVALAGLEADVSVHLLDVPLSGSRGFGGGSATLATDEAGLRTLLATIDGFPAATVGLDAPDVTAMFELTLFALTIPVGVALTPSASDGELVLTPASLRVADAEISADALVAQFGAIATTVVRDWEVCIAQYLPRDIALTDVRIDGDVVRVELDIDGAILDEGALAAKGACA